MAAKALRWIRAHPWTILAVLVFASLAYTYKVSSDRGEDNARAVAQIQKLGKTNREQSCSVLFAVFKELRTQVVQGERLLKTTTIFNLTPQQKRQLDRLNRDRLARVTNGRLPSYCAKLRRLPDTVYSPVSPKRKAPSRPKAAAPSQGAGSAAPPSPRPKRQSAGRPVGQKQPPPPKAPPPAPAPPTPSQPSPDLPAPPPMPRTPAPLDPVCHLVDVLLLPAC